ncbi:MAG TPA: PIG-L family deacetylase [Chloroflexota bacterium]|nr:PIG-L family deacetylase [Chloroflexota bacterium]
MSPSVSDLTERDAAPLHVVGVGAHPDDVAVGAGGLIASYAGRGHRTTILTVTYGETVRPPGPQQEEARRVRRTEGEDIARALGATAVNLGLPGNTIIPSWEMKALLVNALRRLEANVILFPPPWDTHADHRNLSATMKDVLYYVGHAGMAFDAPPVSLRSAWMYSIEMATEELHRPDLLFDVTPAMARKLDALTGTRPIFGADDGPFGMRETVQVWNRFWGMRCGVLYAEPLYQSWGSMKLAQLTRSHARVETLPLIP